MDDRRNETLERNRRATVSKDAAMAHAGGIPLTPGPRELSAADLAAYYRGRINGPGTETRGALYDRLMDLVRDDRDGGIRDALARAFADPLARAGFADVTGPYGGGLTTENGVSAAFADTLARWGGADGCLYTTIALPAGREASLEDCPGIGMRFAEKAFPGHQSLVAVHYDGRPSIHIVTCAVSFLDGADLGERMLPKDEQERLIKDLCARMPGVP